MNEQTPPWLEEFAAQARRDFVRMRSENEAAFDAGLRLPHPHIPVRPKELRGLRLGHERTP